MKKLKIAFLLFTFALLQGCQQNEPIQKPVLNAVELENLLKTNSVYADLVTELNIAANAFLGDLTSNFSRLPKEELENMNRIWLKYGSGEDFIKFAAEDEKAIFQQLTPNTYNIDERITKLSDKIDLRYSFEKTNLLKILINLHEGTGNTKFGRTLACSGYCDHIALSEYYRLQSAGMSGSHLVAYANGVYNGCMRACQ
jgi:hypothetical protein